MAAKPLAELLAAAPGAVLAGGPGGAVISGLTTDSRAVRPGDLFAALAGGRTDGHRFLGAAAAAGAAALLVDAGRGAEAPAGPAVVEAGDVRLALGAMADRFYDHPSAALDLVGVTGTNGKTTVTYLLEAMARAAGRVPGVIGTIDCRWRERVCPAPNTTPEAVELQRTLREMADDGVQVVAMEASSHALELRRLVGCRFRVAAFTNLGRDHLDFHPDLEHYFAAKRRLFTEFEPEASVVNVDDPWGRRLLRAARGARVPYGLSPDAAFRAVDVAADAQGLRFAILAEGGRREVASPLIGTHNVWNILAAAAASRALGLPWEAVTAGAAAMALVPGRFERVPGAAGPVVLVDYAHTPEALENALRVARTLTRGRLAVVFGCGGDRDRGKRPLMGAAAGRLADRVFITSDNPRSEDPVAIIREILAGIGETSDPAAVRIVPDRREAIRSAIVESGEEDLVLVAGKGHEDHQTAAGRTLPFSDRDEARSALEGARCRG